MKHVYTVVVTNPLDDPSFLLRTFEDLENAQNFAADISDAEDSTAVVVQNPFFPTYLERQRPGYVRMILFKPSGKYYTEEDWQVPDDAIGPYDMDRSPDFRRISGGPVLVTSDRWGYPHLFPGEDRQQEEQR